MGEAQNCKNFRYDKANSPKIQEALSSIDWEDAFINKTVEEMWELFIIELHDKRNKYIPVAKTRKRVFPKWMTNKILKCIKKRCKAWSKILT